LRNTNDSGAPDFEPFAYGGTNWKPVTGDWDSDGADSIGVYSPDAIWYLKNDIAQGEPNITPFAYGVGNWVPTPGEWNRLPALRAASGPGPGATRLTQADLDGLMAAAFARSATPPPAVHFGITDLGADYLGLAVPGKGPVWLDDDAAGYGWFADPTPLEDSEFAGCLCGSPARGRVDLWTVVLHELGHLTGLPDLESNLDPEVLMTATLPTGTRRV
jgi:hypothetical protein